MAQAWPSSQSATGQLMNALPKVVFSSTPTDFEWSNTRVTDRPVEEEIPELKGQRGKDMVVFGGASFARSLAAHGLIDEYHLYYQPVVLGTGKRFFAEPPGPLKFLGSEKMPQGAFLLRYAPVRE